MEARRPQRPATAFMFFANENRESIQQAHPYAHHSEIGRIMGDAWIDLPAEKRERYEGLARKDKDRYEREMSSYLVVQPIMTRCN